MKKTMFKNSPLICCFFMCLIFTLFFLIMYIFNVEKGLLITLILLIVCTSIFIIFLGRIFQRVYLTELGIESRFFDKVYKKISWNDIDNITYSYGNGSMIAISLKNNDDKIIINSLNNKIAFKTSLYKVLPNSLAEVKINLILSIGGFKSRFMRKKKIYRFLQKANYLDELDYLNIDNEDKAYIKHYYKDNLSVLTKLIKKHYHIRFKN